MKGPVESRAARRFAGFLTIYAVAVIMIAAGHVGYRLKVEPSPLLTALGMALVFGPFLMAPVLLLCGLFATFFSLRWAVWALTLAITMTTAVVIGVDSRARIEGSQEAGGAGWGWRCIGDC